ncbi:probable disease resistance protein At4g27220 [Pistacia vera]|uniref:probable disease resistance protein At4g27220 n=1 Tax=Pistacia vera TaxID=55513 RepID=UPI00126343F1|nr:probable disease resistance protein At4g27220 [Pistacia vera]
MAAELGGAAVSGVASKAAESAFDFIGQHISYLFKYGSYINDLKNQVEDLGNARERVEHQVDEARRRGEVVEKDVEQWLKRVNDFTEGVVKPIIGDEDKAKKRCFIGLCPNLIQRYMLGKKAAKALPGGADLSGKGNFSSVSYRPAIQRTESIYITGYEAFDSRMPVLQGIMEALKDANVNKVGVYGMPGVGKTTLVKKVAWQAKEDELFDEVVITTVTQTPDIKKIQGEIADQLGLTFHEESVSGRSHRLRDRLKREKSILVILDDIWAKLDLDAVGIPYGDVHRGIGQRKDDERQYKILLTSRDQHVLCNHMNIQKNFLVDLLSDEEAWYLFLKTAGDSVETSDIRPIAVEVVGKCARLPIAIETVAKALKSKSLPVWEDALRQLRRSNPRQIEGMDERVCSIIELSYNFLKSEEKSLFLLCGLLNASPGIVISDLLKYSMGLHLFRDVYTLEDGRNRLLTLIHNLKASSLLLDSIINYSVKMHDLIHAVVISIASSEEFMFNIKNVGDLKEVLEEKIPKTSTAITLPYGDIGDELPQSLEYPKLKFFYLLSRNHYLQIPELLFQGMKELEVLDLTGIRLLPLPSSLCCLKNLQTLCLDSCVLDDIAIVGELKKLEILSLLYSDIEKLPEEIGQLTRLKMLDLSECSNLKLIPPNVISSLSRLEELYMGNGFRHWEIEGLMNNHERKNASILELKQLSRLTTLEIRVHNLEIIPQDFFFLEKLKRYRILIGDVWDWSWHATYGETSRMLKIKLNNSISLIHRVKILLKRTEELHLELNGVKNAIDELDEDGFAQLKHLHVRNGHELLYILNFAPSKTVFPKLESLFLHNLIKLEKICGGKLFAESFSKLRILKVEKCDMLVHLFSFSDNKKFSQLQEIEVIDCKNLKEIFGENERNSKFEFTQLHSLVLQCLPRFISFGVKVVFPRLENLKLSSINIENIWVDQPQPMSSYIQCLKSLTVEECNGLKFLFSSSIVKSLVQLQRLVICNCKLMEAVIFDSQGLEGEDKIIDLSFPKLFYLKLVGLPKLTRFGIGNSIEFPTLNELHIQNCSNLKTFFHNSFGADTLRKEPDEVSLEKHITDINPLFNEKVAFTSLEKMIFFHLDNLQLIWHNQFHKDSFSKLKEVRVEYCENLLTIFPSNSTQGFLTFHNLETLIVENCWNMKSLFPVSIATGLLQLNELWISFCGLEEIVAKEEVEGTPTFLFPQLTFLKLENLAELRHFYLGLHTIECPMLKRLVVHNCGKTKVNASNGESQPALFSFEKVGFSNLEHLELSEFPTLKERFWNAKVPASSFYSLKLLVLDTCLDTSTAIPFNVLCNLKNLEKLEIRNCDTLKEVFDMEGQLNVDRHTLKKSNLEVLDFNNLKSFKVHNCRSLRRIFTPSIILGLAQLEEIEVKNCALIEESILKEEEKEADIEKIVVPQLNSIILESLPNLTSFYSGMNTLECPALKAITVAKCPQIETFVFTNIKHQSDHIVPLLSEKVVFPSLEKMFLSRLDNLHLIWHNQLHAGSFGKLKQVTIEFCEKLMTIVPANNSQGLLTFHNLESLHVEKCWSLKSLFPVSTATGLVKLKKLSIYSCELEEIVANEEVEGAPSLDLSGKVMPNLESLSLNVDAFRLQTKRPLEGFCKLKELCLRELNDESIPFFYGFLKRLYSLEILTLRDIRSKELFLYERDATKEDSQVDPFLPHLRDLRI